MSWKSMVQAMGEAKPSTNACRYATEREAAEAGLELMSRWMLVESTSTEESSEAVNYRFNFELYKSERIT